MKSRQKQPVKDRRDIGRVVPLIEKMEAAREFSSCCVGAEALLETRDELEIHVEKKRNKSKN